MDNNKRNINLFISIVITLFFICVCVAFYYIKTNQYSVDAFEHKADYFFYNEKYFSSAKYYKKVINMGKISNKNYINLAVSLIKLENYKTAIKYLNILLKTKTDIAETYYLLAYANYRQLFGQNMSEENIKHMISLLEKSIELNESYSSAYYLRGEIYERIGQYENARNWYTKALSSGIENTEIFYGLIAHSYFKENNFDAAIEYYEKAIQSNKNYISAYCNMADIYAMQKNYYEAEKIYLQVLETNRDYILPYYKIGNLYYLQEYYKEAITWYEKALVINKDNELVNYYMGMAYKKLNDLQLALKYLEIAAYCGSDDAVEELRKISENF